jgi:hypothetical protein
MMMHKKVGGAAIQPRESATPQEMWYVMKPLHGGHPRRLSYHNHMVLTRRLEEIQDEEEKAPTPSEDKETSPSKVKSPWKTGVHEMISKESQLPQMELDEPI